MKIEAPTLVELKKKIRVKLKWPDRRTWTETEQKEFDEKYKIVMKQNVFAVEEK